MVSTYIHYQDSKIEWVGQIPESWSVTSVGKVYEIVLGKMLQPTPLSPEDELVPYLKAMNVQDGYLKTDTIDQMYASQSDIENLKILAGDLLVCEGGDVARSVVIKKDLDRVIFQNSLHRVRSYNNEITFLHYFLISLRNSGFVDILVNRATIAHFTKDKFKSLKMPLPSIVEQRAIVRFLNKRTREIEDLIADKEKLLSLFEEKRQAMITEVVTKGLNPNAKMKCSGVEWFGEIPEHWESIRLKYLLKDGWEGIKIGPFGSALKLEMMVDSGFKVYGQENLIKSDFTLGNRFLSDEMFEELKNYEVIEGDVLVSMMGTIGKCKVVPNNIIRGIMDSHLIRMRFNKNRVIPEYIALVISEAQYIKEQFNLNSKGSIMSGLNSSIIKSLKIILPPVEEQRVILKFFNEQEKGFSNIINATTNQIQKLKEYRQSLIYEAVTGKIDVRDFELAEK